MIGRVVHYRSRRILIFCGERSHDLHPVYGIVDTGVAVGEEAEARTYQSNKFHEAESAVALGASNEAKITSAARLPVVESGLPLGQSADAAAYVNVYASVGGGILIDSSADTMKTISVFSEVGSGIAASGDIETIKTSVAKLTESEEVIAVGGNSEGFVTSHHNEAEVESGVVTLQDAEAYVEQPTSNIILAGKYATNAYVLPFETLSINIPIAYHSEISGEDETANGLNIELDEVEGIWVVNPINGMGHALASNLDAFDTGQIDDFWHIFTDDNTFTVTSDTEVTMEQITIFNRYFQRVSNNNA